MINSRQHEVHVRAFELFKKHGLENWHFKFDRAIQRAGSCHFGKRTISLSIHMVLKETITMEQIENVILHEMAHAIVGFQHGHNDVWRAKAIEIGCDGARCHTLKFMPEPKYKITCPCGSCNFSRSRFKQKSWSNKVCLKCKEPVQVISTV